MLTQGLMHVLMVAACIFECRLISYGRPGMSAELLPASGFYLFVLVVGRRFEYIMLYLRTPDMGTGAIVIQCHTVLTPFGINSA